MNRAILNFKVIILLSLVTGVAYGIELIIGHAMDEMAASAPVVCPVDGVVERHDGGVLVSVKCGSTAINLSTTDSLAVLTKHLPSAKCAVYQGKQFGSSEWRCEL